MPTFALLDRVLSRGRSSTILELDLTHEIVERVPDHPLAKIGARNRPPLREVLDALDRAADDESVAGILVTIGNTTMAMGHAQELRDAIRRFRRSGKFAIAWSESFGEMALGTVAYFIATACDEIWLQPTGSLALTGIAVETTFLAGALDKAGIDYEVTKRHEYKTFGNRFTETGFTEAHRESVEALLGSQFESLIEAIAEGRDRKPDEVRYLVDDGPYLAADAVEAGLVDALLYRDEAWARVRERAAATTSGDEADLLFVEKYAKKHKPKKHRKAPVIALVHVDGGIMRGRGGYNPLLGGPTVGGDVVASALRQAGRDDDVKAVVLRVNSPGGSAVASDTIWREVKRLVDGGTPVVASMANVAASGGYYVAASASRIVAQPGTVTGSIGVIVAIPVIEELASRLGFTWETTAYGRHANLLSVRKHLSAEEQSKIDTSIDQTYHEFVGRVAEGRGMQYDAAEAVARGRVWSGSDALDRGLVDELGGMREAFTAARREAGIADDQPIKVRVLPKVPPLEALGLQTPDNSEHAAGQEPANSLIGRTKLGRLAGTVGAGTGAGSTSPEVLVLLPPLQVRG